MRAGRGSDTRRDGRRLEAILARLSELRGRREGLIDLVLDGPLSKAELSERLVPLDAQIKGLEDEAKTLRREEEELRDAEEDEQTMLRRLEASLPSDLDALTSPERREFYRRLGLTVLANRDKSLTLRWFVDVELEVIRCQEEGMSTR
jgi:DNA repair exonuclease SbcCD ATPase subunit